tara:strand:+ start:498 stop:1124 length:627 start_codon:yes stop_codon:yes gene_type:complete
LKIDSVKIFGERHTGTNALNLFLRENFELKFKYYEFLGWKHRLAPEKVEWMKYDTNNVLFIFLFRNPYTWLNSMYKEPYYHHYLKINDRSFEEFIKFSIEDYENSICLWNLKNDSYLRMSKEVKYSLNIRIEDFRLDQSKIHALIGEIMGIESAEFIAFTNYVNGRGIEINKDIDKSLTIPELTNSEINYINSFLSRSIMKEIGYDFL